PQVPPAPQSAATTHRLATQVPPPRQAPPATPGVVATGPGLLELGGQTPPAPRALGVADARGARRAPAEVAGPVAVVVDVRDPAALVPAGGVQIVVDVAGPRAAVLAVVRRPVERTVTVGVARARVLVEVEGVEARVESAVELHEDDTVVRRVDGRGDRN